ncbi:hypothetical protein [Nocardioides nanhaiensis]|uniref:Uncharacterized protein n=1 Tax=Nocardioides nanhaiensis TaxID=1476871 RepID=A0ABP8W5M5_9ACTN
MNDHPDPTGPAGLSALLDDATAWVERPDLAGAALAGARRRRRRRRGLATGAVAAAAVAAVLVTPLGGALLTDSPPAGVGPTIAPSADPTSPGAEPVDAAPLQPEDVQQPWDPDDVEQLPWDGALGLPRDLTIGQGPAERGAARAATAVDGTLHLLGPSGWYTGADLPAGVGTDPTVAIAPDGSRTAVVGGSVLAVSSPDGWTSLPLPRGFSGAEDFYVDLDFVGADRLLLGEWNRFWEIDASSGEAVRLPFDRIDEVVPAGDAVLADRYSDARPNTLELWREGQVEAVGDTSALESTQRPASDAASLATVRANGATYGEGDATDTDGLLVLGLADLSVRGFLPVPTRGSYYSDSANLTPLGFTDPDTVLAEVRPAGSPETTWLVTWDVESGALRKVASFPTDQPQLSLAIDAIPG